MTVSTTSSGEHSGEGDDASQFRRLMNPIPLLITIMLPCDTLYQVIASVHRSTNRVCVPTSVPVATLTDLAHMVVSYELPFVKLK
jgi:hypothetical protein